MVSFSLAPPGFAPKRVSPELRRGKWGGYAISPSGVYRVLRRHGLNTRAKRRSLVAGYAALGELEQRPAPRAGQPAVDGPGALEQMDLFPGREAQGHAGRRVAAHGASLGLLHWTSRMAALCFRIP